MHALKSLLQRVTLSVPKMLVWIAVRLVLVVIGVLVTITLLCLVSFIASGPNVPGDKEMLAHYAGHTAQFGRLAEMFAAEQELFLVYPDTGQCETVERKRVEPGKNPRCDEYVRLFRSLELGWAYINGPPVYLQYYTWGLTGHGLTKGFLYTADPTGIEGVVVENTARGGRPTPRYREIDEGWYIYFW